MAFIIRAACGCHIGRTRSNNEDNLYFDGPILRQTHTSMKRPSEKEVTSDTPHCFAVFDGMGGEEAGETAAFLAGQGLKDYLTRERVRKLPAEQLLKEACFALSDRIYAASGQLEYGQMGSTAAMLYVSGDGVFACNLGDSPIFRLRNGQWLRLSEEHVEQLPAGVDPKKQKPRLTQYLGVCPEELALEPYIVKEDVQAEDVYLLCSDGLTDMVNEEDICTILGETSDPAACVALLTGQALESGGRDNISVIVIRIKRQD